jgi:hypothetical protein
MLSLVLVSGAGDSAALLPILNLRVLLLPLPVVPLDMTEVSSPVFLRRISAELENKLCTLRAPLGTTEPSSEWDRAVVRRAISAELENSKRPLEIFAANASTSVSGVSPESLRWSLLFRNPEEVLPLLPSWFPCAAPILVAVEPCMLFEPRGSMLRAKADVISLVLFDLLIVRCLSRDAWRPSRFAVLCSLCTLIEAEPVLCIEPRLSAALEPRLSGAASGVATPGRSKRFIMFFKLARSAMVIFFFSGFTAERLFFRRGFGRYSMVGSAVCCHSIYSSSL